ncbi:MAG TPA: RNA 2',3'-cyclic phosphodiesterase [Candidatus Elarobacter sp.]
MTARQRLFVAVELDDASRAACAGVAERLRIAGFDGRWVAPANYHLTIAFLGGVDEERAGAVAAALRDVAPRIGPFAVRLDAVGAYPSARKARIAWTGPAARVPAFEALGAAVRGALLPLGFSFERDADPHVTLARTDGRHPLPPVAPPSAPPVAVDAIALYQSFTEQTGARYVVLERFALAGTSRPDCAIADS